MPCLSSGAHGRRRPPSAMVPLLRLVGAESWSCPASSGRGRRDSRDACQGMATSVPSASAAVAGGDISPSRPSAVSLTIRRRVTVSPFQSATLRTAPSGASARKAPSSTWGNRAHPPAPTSATASTPISPLSPASVPSGFIGPPLGFPPEPVDQTHTPAGPPRPHGPAGSRGRKAWDLHRHPWESLRLDPDIRGRRAAPRADGASRRYGATLLFPHRLRLCSEVGAIGDATEDEPVGHCAKPLTPVGDASPRCAPRRARPTPRSTTAPATCPQRRP